MTLPAGPTPREISTMLAEEIEAVVQALKIDVKASVRGKLICFSPWNNHPNPKLEIAISGRPGKWNDWIEGRYGDALGLVACVVSGRPEPKDRAAIGEAMAWSRKYFGIEIAAFDQAKWEQRCAEADARAKVREAAAIADLARKRASAKGLWLHAQPLAPDDAGGLYLQARGVDLRQLARQPRAIRFSAAQQWWDGDQVGHVGPALMSAMTLADGSFASLHRIWIDPARPGQKADIDPPRKMWPDSQAAAIRLWRGASGLSEKAAEKAGLVEDVVLCEGVEDGLSIALMTPELRIHAVGSLPGLLSYIPSPVAGRLIVAADNDWGKPQAEQLLRRACERLAGMGKTVALARSPEGKDFNDLLRAG